MRINKQMNFFPHLKKRMMELTSYLEKSQQFENWIKVIFSLSEKIYENALRGITDKGDVLVMVDEKEPASNIVIHSTGRTISPPNPFPDKLYKDTVDSLIKSFYQKHPNQITYLVPLKWKFLDSDKMYTGVIMQVIENYVAGGVPRDTDIIEIYGGVPRNCFKHPMKYGKEYYDRESAVKPLPPWDVYIHLSENVPEQQKEKEKITLELASRYLSRFFLYLWSFRICFHGKESVEKFRFLTNSSSALLHHTVFALADAPLGQVSECKSEWIIHSFLGAGSYGEVFKACCEDENHCGYAIKVIKPGNKLTPFLAEREIAMWKKIQGLGLCPMLIEYYHHKGKIPEEDYFILVTEAYDKSIKDALRDVYDPEPQHDNIRRLRVLLFEKVKDILLKLHDNGIAHGDAHFGNFMIKCENKEVLKFADTLLQAIVDGHCQIGVIDFGFTTTLELLGNEYDKETSRLYPLLESPRLYSLGCFVKDDPIFNFKSPRRERGRRMFNILCFYDFAEMINEIDEHWSNEVELLSMIIPLQKAISGSNCKAGRAFVG
jgi:tRNA A-37 threonylcarbamoyl transferase component Bud32